MRLLLSTAWILPFVSHAFVTTPKRSWRRPLVPLADTQAEEHLKELRENFDELKNKLKTNPDEVRSLE